MEVIESPQGTPTTVIGDAAKIQRIIGCVVSNAVAHTNAGGILIEWGELVDHNVKDAEEKEDSIRIGISMCVRFSASLGSVEADARVLAEPILGTVSFSSATCWVPC